MNVRTLCLAILNCQEATGYEIRKLSQDGPYSYFVQVSYGSIYPTLAKLQADGAVTVRIEPHEGKPDRKVYAITDQGREELIHALCEVPGKDLFKSEFLLLATNADLSPAPIVMAAIDLQIEHVEQELEMIGSLLENEPEPALKWAAGLGKTTLEAKRNYLLTHRQELEAIAATGLIKQAAE